MNKDSLDANYADTGFNVRLGFGKRPALPRAVDALLVTTSERRYEHLGIGFGDGAVVQHVDVVASGKTCGNKLPGDSWTCNAR